MENMENMKTLFAVDFSKSMNEFKFYFEKIREIKQKYYNSSRGDKFYIWGSGYFYLNEKEIDRFINEEVGKFDERHSYYIAEIGKETKNENFEHLIIVTNGKVSCDEIDESNKRFHEYGLSYKYVKSYIIGNDGDESVSCPYMRDCISETVLIDNYGNEKVLKYFPKIKKI
jgi:hypothetical protein